METPDFYVKNVGGSMDLKALLKDLDQILQKHSFQKWQICLTHRDGVEDPDEQLYEGTGRLKDGFNEYDYRHFNSHFRGTGFEEIYNDIARDWEIGRMRLALLPSHKCYSMHEDNEDYRTHLALVTNPHVYVFYENGKSFHIPADGNFYDMYTGENHTVFNAGPTDRIHLIADTREKQS